MPLTRTRENLRDDIRKFANVQGTTALQRHPSADINDYINRALGSLHRRLRAIDTDQRILSTSTGTTTAGTTTYSLPSDFDFLISVDMTIDSRKHWLQAFDLSERPELTTPDTSFIGKPFVYRLRGSNIEFLPSPTGEYSYTLWYTGTATQLSSDAATFDTISRLDDYIIAYASRLIAIKDKNFDLVQACKDTLLELEQEIDILARGRDKNSPPQIVDVYRANRWGRTSRRIGR